MKKYLVGGWNVIKNYLFTMIFFYVFFVAFFSKASIFSIAFFIIMSLLIYFEMANYAPKDKRKFGKSSPFDGALYALIGIAPIIIIQVIISQINLDIQYVNFDVLKTNLVKAFVAPMLFIAKAGGYKLIGFAMAWASIVIMAFLGYFAGYKNFDISEHVRKLFGLQPRQKKPVKKRRSI